MVNRRTDEIKWTFTVLEANQDQGMVRFSVDRQNVTPNIRTIDIGGASLNTTSLFQFSIGASGATVLSLTTSVLATEKTGAAKKKGGPPCFLFFPLCWPCLCWYCFCNPGDKFAAMAGNAGNVEAGMRKNTTDTVRLIHFALQAAQQDGSINGGMGMQHQQQLRVGMHVGAPFQTKN